MTRDEPWSDLEEYAEALLRAEAEKRGCDLRDLGILSRRRQAHIKRYEMPLSRVPRATEGDEEEDA